MKFKCWLFDILYKLKFMIEIQDKKLIAVTIKKIISENKIYLLINTLLIAIHIFLQSNLLYIYHKHSNTAIQ